MLWTTYNFNFKSLLIFGKHTRNGRHKSSSFHLFTSVLKNSLIRTKWHWVKMNFLLFLHINQGMIPGEHFQVALPGFWRFLDERRLFLLQMTCPFWPHVSLKLYRKHSFTPKQLYICSWRPKNHMWWFKFLSTFLPLLIFSHRYYKDFLEQTQSIFRPLFHKWEEAQQKVNSGNSYAATWNKQSPRGTVSFFHR